MAWKCMTCQGWHEDEQKYCPALRRAGERASALVAKLAIENKRLRQQIERLREDGRRVVDLVTIGNNVCNRLRDLWTAERERREAMEKLLHDEPEARQHDDG